MEWTGDWREVMAPHLDAECRTRLASACVGLAGAGGLGSNCAVLLARSGIGRLVIADFDRVSPSNLNRQHFFPEHLGLSKVVALERVIRGINPGVRVEAHDLRLDPENTVRIFRDCDPVVEAVDRAEIKKMLFEALAGTGVFVVSASGMAGWGGPPMRCRAFGSRGVVVGDGRCGVAPGMPVLAPRVMMAAAMQADQVLARILGPCPGMETD